MICKHVSNFKIQEIEREREIDFLKNKFDKKQCHFGLDIIFNIKFNKTLF